MKPKMRQVWKNFAGNQRGVPLRIYEPEIGPAGPEQFDDVRRIILEAEASGYQVRAVGSGHSWSDVTLTDGYLALPTGLDEELPLETHLLKPAVAPAHLIRIGSGMRIRELNELLRDRGLALPNMGGYDGQTFVGAMSTSTHGSGIGFGPLSDFVRSIDLISDGAMSRRIEPTDGITDPAAFAREHLDWSLVQDDLWFNAVVVSMGCMGVITSIILEVQAGFWLKEVRTLSTWKKEKRRIGSGLAGSRHYELLLNPHAVGGEHSCLITTRRPVRKPVRPSFAKSHRNFLTELLASMPVARNVFDDIFAANPRESPELLERSLRGLVDDDYTEISYKVFNIGAANHIPSLSAEIAFPMRDDLYIAGVDRILDLARLHATHGQLYHTAPISLRFVRGSSALMSPQYGGDTCMVEIIQLIETPGVYEMYRRYEEASYAFEGRPHWGQINSLTGSNDLVRSMYPRYEDWIAVCRELNGRGTFDSPFSKRVGFGAPEP